MPAPAKKSLAGGSVHPGQSILNKPVIYGAFSHLDKSINYAVGILVYSCNKQFPARWQKGGNPGMGLRAKRLLLRGNAYAIKPDSEIMRIAAFVFADDKYIAWINLAHIYDQVSTGIHFPRKSVISAENSKKQA